MVISYLFIYLFAKSKMAVMTSNASAALQPVILTLSCRAHYRLSVCGIFFSKYCNNIPGRGSINPPPLVPRWGYDSLVRPRVKKTGIISFFAR